MHDDVQKHVDHRKNPCRRRVTFLWVFARSARLREADNTRVACSCSFDVVGAREPVPRINQNNENYD